MTKQIKKEAPVSATHFICTPNSVQYYKKVNGQVYVYVFGCGWVTSTTSLRKTHLLKVTPNVERICVAAAVIVFWCFVYYKVV